MVGMLRKINANLLLRRFVGAFPPPEFLVMHAVAVDISDTSIKCFDVKHTAAGYIPQNFSTVVLSEGVVHGGIVRDTDSLSQALLELRKKHKRSFAFVSLPEELAYLFTVRIPKDGNTNIREAVEFALGENVPIALEDAVFDYDVISESLTETTVSVTVYESAVVQGYIDAFHSAGFEIRACELEAHSVVRSVVPSGFGGVSMVIDFGRNRTGIAIARGQSPIFTTTVHVGGAAVTQAIMELKSVSEEEADAIKREQGLAQAEDAKLQEVLTKETKKLVDEIERHYQFWDSRRDEHGERIERIEKIYLCGGAAAFLGLAEYMAAELNVPVTTANVWQNLFDMNEHVPQLEKPLSWQYATAVGLLLIDMK